MRFEIKRAKRGRLRRNQWRVVLVADNNKTLMASETYNNHDDAVDLVTAVAGGAWNAQVIDTFLDKGPA